MGGGEDEGFLKVEGRGWRVEVKRNERGISIG
jgi:hypothetical protein